LLSIFILGFGGLTAYFLRVSRALVERRMAAGPGAEARGVQKLAQALNGLALAAVFIVAGLDHRLGWSHLGAATTLAGNLLFLIACGLMAWVFAANPFGASTIALVPDQVLTDGGPYRWVRHPMYSVAILLFLAMGLALGSLWALVPTLAVLPVLMLRTIDEERLLFDGLSGYRSYAQRVRWRFMPGLW
jgi:protein-S-isoprenylcysteine O-methyltransferase Ste14